MRSKKTKKDLIEVLKRNPVVSAACNEGGVSTASFYRWKVLDHTFAHEVEKAQSLGRSVITDMAKSSLIHAIEDGMPWAIKFWLQNHRNLYMMSFPGNEPDDYAIVIPVRKKRQPATTEIIQESVPIKTEKEIVKNTSLILLPNQQQNSLSEQLQYTRNQKFIIRMNLMNSQLAWLRAVCPKKERVVHCTLLKDESTI